jgi:hypothetical protein
VYPARRRFSRTLRLVKTFSVWGRYATPDRATSVGDFFERSSPSSSMVPPLTDAIPEMDLRRVLFPDPFGPTITVIFPGKA